jgi:hypothetical protein
MTIWRRYASPVIGSVITVGIRKRSGLVRAMGVEGGGQVHERLGCVDPTDRARVRSRGCPHLSSGAYCVARAATEIRCRLINCIHDIVYQAIRELYRT